MTNFMKELKPDCLEDLIKKLKDVKQALVSKDMTGEEWEEREEILEKLEDVTTYLKDALGKGIEF